ncbi:MAG: aldehyde dehydrogenase family protein [Spirochaetaceae bacterium]|jgi:succinate-semialdehyde dehydrogenase/glutarate-semialdehyde dehydrogenase|nr:aldehyde dehydrogenase family protein [Spirochaetaceae bacterium]
MTNIGEKVPGGKGLQNTARAAEKIQAARKAQGLWAALPYRERARRLKRAAGYLGDHFDELTELIHRENGKVKIDALAAEVLPAVMALSYYIKEGKKFLAPRALRGGNLLMFNKKSRMIYKPYGVVGIISPWNYPFAIPFSEVVMALLAGNAVILKVASDTPGVGRALEAVFTAADLPDDLFSYIEMPGKEAGPAFITGGVDKLFFTGSTAVGRELLALSAPRLLPLVLELGGADAAIICDDADLDRAAAGILWSGFSNAGQSCGGAQRILVCRPVYEAFLKKLCGLVEKLRVGKEGDMGPMTTLRQKQAVQKQVEACVADGARIAAQSPGGSFQDESLFAPALVLTGVHETMPVMREEIFGPVVAVVPVEDDGEALRIANSSSYGLTGSVWSRDHRRAKKLAAGINAGAVMINDHLMSHGLAETPWGGFGDSGLGKTHGEAGFREMLKAQVVVDDLLPGIKRNLWWQPYSEQTYQGIRAITELLAGTTLGRRLKALPRVMKIVFRYWEK